MNSVREVQQTRLLEKFERELGEKARQGIGDPSVTDLIVNQDGHLWFDAHGKGMWDTNYLIPATQVESLIGTVAAFLNTVVNAQNPILEGELPGGIGRFEGLVPPVVSQPCFAIRKPAQLLYTLDDYVRAAIVTENQAEILRTAILHCQNIVIAGGTGSGKTTLTSALIHEMAKLGDPGNRYAILEDTYELQCRAPNAIQLRTCDAVDLTRLVRATMRLRPDRIIIGEVRGPEALSMLKAWNTGHPGGVTTVHANSARAALTRLSSLVQEAGVPPQPELIAETVDLIAFIVRKPDGRHLKELVRVEGYSVSEGYRLTPIEPE
jgi:type IV secretion system protein VirB11